MNKYANMLVAPVQGDNEDFAYECKEMNITTGNASDWFFVRPKVTKVAITIFPIGAGTGYVESCNENVYDIKQAVDTNTPITRKETWAKGSVSIIATDGMTPVTAFRLVVTSGTMGITARGN